MTKNNAEFMEKYFPQYTKTPKPSKFSKVRTQLPAVFRQIKRQSSRLAQDKCQDSRQEILTQVPEEELLDQQQRVPCIDVAHFLVDGWDGMYSLTSGRCMHMTFMNKLFARSACKLGSLV